MPLLTPKTTSRFAVKLVNRTFSSEPLKQHVKQQPQTIAGMFKLNLIKPMEIEDFQEEKSEDILLSPIGSRKFDWDLYNKQRMRH